MNKPIRNITLDDDGLTTADVLRARQVRRAAQLDALKQRRYERACVLLRRAAARLKRAKTLYRKYRRQVEYYKGKGVNRG